MKKDMEMVVLCVSGGNGLPHPTTWAEILQSQV